MTAEKTLDPSFIGEIQQLWSAEKMLTEAMPLMIEKAQNTGLKKNLALHLAETDQHKVALELIGKQSGFEVHGAENEELKNILDEGKKGMSSETSLKGLDAAIITGALQIEHYEIAAYEKIVDRAAALGYEAIAKRLALTFEEERQTHIKLHFLKKNYIEESSVIGITE